MRQLIGRLLAGTLVVAGACSSSADRRGDEDTPPASAGHCLVYSNDLGMVLLVNAGLGGMISPPASTQTRIWGWNGNKWKLLDSSGPPIRNLAGVTYDTRRQTLVMHGGTYDINTSYDETWEWTRKSGWRKFTGPGPGLRDHTQLAYDPERGRAVLFGGNGADPNTAFSDTWEFDGAHWERVSTVGPPARVHHAMHYDPTLQRVVAFGGNTPGRGDLGDTWGWDGSHWTEVAPSTFPRTHAAMTFDRRRQALVALGGLAPSGANMIERTAVGWAPLPAAPDPGARYLPAVAYDLKRDVLVLFGGGDPNGTNLLDDTWEFDGTWRRARDR